VSAYNEDKEVAATIVINSIEQWNIDTCLFVALLCDIHFYFRDLLYMCKSHLNKDNALLKKVDDLYNQMEVYQEILRLDST
jgi:hypothetical protein